MSNAIKSTKQGALVAENKRSFSADLADVGFFGADSTHDELCRVVAYMNVGGSADHAAYAAEHADTDLERNGSMILP